MRQIGAALILIVSIIITPAVVSAQVTNTKLFRPFIYSFTDMRVEAAAVGDVNSDGRNDVVITCVNDKILPHTYFLLVYLQNTTTGKLDNYVSYTMPSYHIYSVDIADMNDDGRNDVVATYEFGVAIYFQNSSRVLSPAVSIGTDGTFRVRTGDFNNDTFMDVAAISFNTWDLDVYIQDSAVPGTFLDFVTYPLNNTTYKDIVVGDINSDGLDDVVLTTDQGVAANALTVLTQNGATGTLNSPVYYPCGSPAYLLGGCAIGNLDGSPGNDVLVSCWRDSWPANSTFVGVWQQSGGILANYTEYLLNSYPNHPVVTGEFNGDGRVDAIACQSDTMGVLFQQTDGSLGDASTMEEYEVPYAVTLNAHSMAVGDLNNDGKDDVVIANYNFGMTILYAWDGTDTIVIKTPNGHRYYAGNQIYITWEANTTDVDSVDLSYSLDGGASWNIIEPDVTVQDYIWTLPNTPSNDCLVRAVAPGGLMGESMVTFSIIDTGIAGLVVTSPNGGESLWVGEPYQITWDTSGSVGPVRLEYSTDNGVNWNTITASTTNDRSYTWTVPDDKSTQCRIRISEASDGDPSDTSDGVFTIEDAVPTLLLTSPLGGERWKVGTSHLISWNSVGPIGNLKIEYSYDNMNTWHTLSSSAADTGLYSWKIPNTPSDTCYVRISEAAAGSPSTRNYKPFSIVTGSEGPEISLNHSALYFGAIKPGTAHTRDQYLIVNNTGGDILHWSAEEITNDADWLRLYNTSGTQSGMVGVGVEPFGLNPGTYNATLRFTDANASNSPLDLPITLVVYNAGANADPFGSFETPLDGSTVMSSIPVTGWALDDIGIDKVTLWRNSPGGGDPVYIGDAVLVEGARPDVEQAYPGYPMNYKAGWGYMMLTNMLPNGGNGTFTIYAYARDMAGREVLLGSKTIHCDNAHAVKPFGAIDTPDQGGMASGTDFRNQGWVLTPMPNQIPKNGSTIFVYIDGQKIGNATYNVYRKDIADLFPGYANSNAAMAIFDFDTSAYENGIHTIQWTATDTGGNTDGIGSRYFTIQNSGFSGQSLQKSRTHIHAASMSGTPGILAQGKPWHRFSDLLGIPVNSYKPVRITTGFSKDKPARIAPERQGVIDVAIPQDERIALDLTQPNEFIRTGYLVNGTRLEKLPIGSSMDQKKGTFYWQVGPAYLGDYRMVFILEDQAGFLTKKNVHVKVVPKYRRSK
jgi:hypothetical protein